MPFTEELSYILQFGCEASVVTPMNLPSQLQQDVEKWASSQGISIEQFILQAVADKINVLSQQVIQSQAEQDFEATAKVLSKQPKVYRKQGILVVDAELPENFDINTFIDDLREERIWEQMATDH